MWLLRANGCLTEVNNSTKLKFGNILFGCLRQVGCLIEVTTNSGFIVHYRDFQHILQQKEGFSVP